MATTLSGTWKKRYIKIRLERIETYVGLPLTSIFFFDTIIEIISFVSNYFNSILDNFTKDEIFVIFTCITLYFRCYDPKIPKQYFFSENLSFYSKFLAPLAKNGKQMMTKPERLVLLLST